MIDVGREVFLLISSVVYALLGMVLLLVAYKLFDAATPHQLDHVIFDDKNLAAAVLVGAFMIALAIIISQAIR